MQISRRPWERKLFLGPPDTTQTVVVVAKLNANPLESHVDKFFNKPCGYREAGFTLTHACSNSLLEMKGRGNFQRSHVMAIQTTTSKRVQQSQKQVPATTGTQCSNDINTYENDPCLVSDHLYHELWHKSLCEKKQILHRGKNQQALTTWHTQMQTLHRKMCSTEQDINGMLKHLSKVYVTIIKCFPTISKFKQWNTYSIIINRKSKEPYIYTLFF